MPLFILNIIGWVIGNWRLLLTVIAGVILLVAVGLLFNRCGKREVKVDLETIQKINKADEKDRKIELQKVIEQNQDVIKDVDNRTELTNVVVTERNAAIDAKIKEVNKNIEAAKANTGREITSAELQCILIPEECK